MATEPKTPQPKAALDDGWISVDERLPEKRYEPVFVYPRPTDYCCEAEIDSAGQWWYGEYEHHFGHNRHRCHPTHWRPLPAPPTLNASKEGSGHG